MAKGSNPSNIIARFIVDAQRLDKWAQSHGTSKQREFATNLLNVFGHASQTQIFPDYNSPADPTGRSEAWLMGEQARFVFNETGVRQHCPADVDIHEWHAGYFFSPFKSKANPESN
jgi:hypothetical protein